MLRGIEAAFQACWDECMLRRFWYCYTMQLQKRRCLLIRSSHIYHWFHFARAPQPNFWVEIFAHTGRLRSSGHYSASLRKNPVWGIFIVQIPKNLTETSTTMVPNIECHGTVGIYVIFHMGGHFAVFGKDSNIVSSRARSENFRDNRIQCLPLWILSAFVTICLFHWRVPKTATLPSLLFGLLVIPYHSRVRGTISRRKRPNLHEKTERRPEGRRKKNSTKLVINSHQLSFIPTRRKIIFLAEK